jgi:hypothetical protein
MSVVAAFDIVDSILTSKKGPLWLLRFAYVQLIQAIDALIVNFETGFPPNTLS